MTKRCTKCGEDKELHEFPNERRSSDGVAARCKFCTSQYQKEWAKRKGGTMYYRTVRYGMSPEEYEELLEEQLNCCACCGSSDPKRKAGFVIDHDHQTGQVRGLLCHSCNIGIGQLGDSIFGLTQAINYLRKHYDNT
ncbi:hypothetical protein SVPG_00013 [Synechococcus phage S-CBP4]|uniref:Endonuclease VII n=1 Tax=Synechococcus phage S-CBP4 TaxID=754059 RepID=M1NXS0_9CAUD|nr:endonuclease VII [Synechococcus phage S-CBP4]AGF91696.1 hypothetical protein SVPG_00013 [Synechococcus phage S-CBP4]